MSAWPIIERELRLRARRGIIVRVRLVAGVLATLTALSTLSWTWQATVIWRPGRILFDALSGPVFAICLFEGVRQTFDCLSREKREGTLGLLFLTDLDGSDVVLGKLVATSLSSFCALLAVFPAMALALPLGGLTGSEFWRTQLVLLSTVFLSLNCGLWTSARYQQAMRSLLVAMGLVLMITAGPVVMEPMLGKFGAPSISPGVALHLAGDAAYRLMPARFWASLAAINVVAGILLFLSGRKLASAWRVQDQAVPPVGFDQSTVNPVEPGASEPDRTDSEFRTADPAKWLASLVPKHRVLVWLSVLLLVFGGFAPSAIMSVIPAASGGLSWVMIHWITQFCPLLFLSFVAARSFAESSQNGTMELLLSTSLSPGEIVAAHWHALWLQLRLPMIASGIFIAYVVLLWLSMAVSTFATASWSQSFLHLVAWGERLFRALATCWLGFYLGLLTRSALTAMGYGLVCVVVVPWIAIGAFWVAFGSSPGVRQFWLMQAFTTLCSLGYSGMLIVWSRSQLLNRFRELAAGSPANAWELLRQCGHAMMTRVCESSDTDPIRRSPVGMPAPGPATLNLDRDQEGDNNQ